MTRSRWIRIGLLLVVPALSVVAQVETIGLRALLAELESEGLQIVYSTSLIDEQTVVQVDRSAPAHQQLERALQQAGLETSLTGGIYYVVRAADPPAAVVTIEPIQYLEEITVSPGKVRLESQIPEERLMLTESYFDSTPHPADDLMHAVKALPSISDQDVSGAFNVRGGVEDELLIHLDGQEIFEPYHLKDFLNLFSALDTEVIEFVDVFAGGFPVEYGDRMSGVMDISLITPDRRRVEIGVGTLNSRVLIGDTFGTDVGSWLISGRAWYPDRVPDAVGLVDEREIHTNFSDVLARMTRKLSEVHELYGGGLLAFDDLEYVVTEVDERELVSAEYESGQLWAGASSFWTPRLTSQAVMSWAAIERSRFGERTSEEDGNLTVGDSRSLRSLSFRSSWSWQPSERHLIKFGYEGRAQDASYDYTRMELDPEEESEKLLSLDLDPDGTFNALWLSDRIAVSEDLVAEVGLRWDAQTHLDEQQLSPRANLLWRAADRTEVRLGWGKYHQAERLNELSVPDGILEFSSPQSSEQWLGSIQHRLRSGHLLRLSGWHKRFDELRPRWENLLNPLELFLEAESDRVLLTPDRAVASGAELMLTSPPAQDDLSWWAGYAYGDTHDVVDGVKIPRRWDRRHSFDAGIDLTLPWRLRAGIGLTVQSGKPATGARLIVDDEGELDYELSDPFGERLGSYRRVDLRLRRSFETRLGSTELVLEIFNLLNVENDCCVDDYEIVGEDPDSATLEADILSWVSFAPALTINWSF